MCQGLGTVEADSFVYEGEHLLCPEMFVCSGISTCSSSVAFSSSCALVGGDVVYEAIVGAVVGDDVVFVFFV